MSLQENMNFAAAMTKKAAEVKDYRLNKEGKRMREIARELVSGKGYIIATASEMRAKYGDRKEFGEHDDPKPAVWGIIEGKDYFSRNKEIRRLSFFTV
jgi:hypothetical protein